MNTDRETALILAADIGATNCRFALFAADPSLRLIRERWYKGADFATFRDVLTALGAPGEGGSAPFFETSRPPDIAVIAPAGPIVRDGNGERCPISNLCWLIDAGEVALALGVGQIRLINDFAAQAYACLMPEMTDTTTVLPGVPVPGVPAAVVGAGTGFGTALVFNAGSGADGLLRGAITIMPGEGGHAEFPFVGKEEMEYARFAAQETGTDRLIGDAVLSGEGLGRLFNYLTGERVHPHEATARAPGLPEVMRWYARFYARACRIYVLQTLALGGLFITGGMALRVPVLGHPAFAEEFYESAAQRHLLEKVPVMHMRKPQSGLWGAALFGLASLHGAV